MKLIGLAQFKATSFTDEAEAAKTEYPWAERVESTTEICAVSNRRLLGADFSTNSMRHDQIIAREISNIFELCAC